MDLSNIELSILVPAFLAGVLVLVTHIPLGRQVLDRGIIFIDLAVAQIAGVGVIAAETFFHLHAGWEVQLCAVVAALLGVLLLFALEKKSSKHLEALIGVVFILAATGSILMLHNNPHGGEHLKELLAGQILWVTQSQLVQAAIWTIFLLPMWFVINKWSAHLGFYIIFALAVTVSVQLVGVYLVFASLIVPALAVKDVPGMRGSLLAFGVATAAYAIGLVFSALWDWPTSPLIVWCLALLAVATVVLVQFKNKGDVEE
jgi:zinc/manganese transport system permease protein